MLKFKLNLNSSVSDLTLFIEFAEPGSIIAKGNETLIFQNSSPIEVTDINYLGNIDKKEILRVESFSSTTTKINTGLSYTATGMSFVSLVFSVDATGALIKIAQVMKLTNRIRYINIDFGEILTKFLDNIGDVFTEGKAVCSESMTCRAKRNNGKFDIQKKPLCYYCYVSIKSTIYGVSFLLLRIMELIGVEKSSSKKKNVEYSAFRVKVLRTLQKIHMVLFNICVLDIVFYGTRRLTQSTLASRADTVDFLLCFISIFFVSVDYALIMIKSLSSFEIFYQLQEIEKKRQDEEKGKNSKKIFSSKPNQIRQKAGGGLPKEGKKEWRKSSELTMKACEINIPAIRYLHSSLKAEILTTKEEDNKQKNSVEKTRFLDQDTKVKMTNFIFLTKMIIYQIVMTTMLHIPLGICTCLVLIELMSLIFNTIVYLNRYHYKGLVFFLKKNGQIFFLVIFLILIFTISLNAEKDKFTPVAKWKQYVAIYLIFGALLLEYLFLFFVIIMNIWFYFKKKDRLALDIPNEVFDFERVKGKDDRDKRGNDDKIEFVDFEEMRDKGKKESSKKVMRKEGSKKKFRRGDSTFKRHMGGMPRRRKVKDKKPVAKIRFD